MDKEALKKSGCGFDYSDDRIIEIQNKTPNATCGIDGIFYDMQNCVARMREQDDIIEGLCDVLEAITDRAEFAFRFEDDKFNFGWMIKLSHSALEKARDKQ